MTKKDCVAMAGIVCDLADHSYTNAWEIAERMADYFETVNPRFDRATFFEACGLVGVVI